MAVADEHESLRGGLVAVTVLASWDDSIGDKLVPLPISTCISTEARLFSHIRTKESQRLYEICFRWSLRADFCIDMDLDESRV